MSTLTRSCCCPLGVLLCSRASLGQPFPVRTVPLSGDATPDPKSGESYTGFPEFAPTLINGMGLLTFEAETSSGKRVLVTENGGAPQIFFRVGDQAPGAPDGVNYCMVDAADYVAWRKNRGKPAGTLPNDTAGGEIGNAQYRLWLARFGDMSNGSDSSAAVPEPAACGLWTLAGALLFITPRLRRESDHVVPSAFRPRD